MTQKDKELLLKDLCARLPYGVIVDYRGNEFETPHWKITTIYPETMDGWISYYKKIGAGSESSSRTFKIGEVKPYLRSMSSMTEEEKEELLNLLFDKEAKYFYIDKEGLIDGKTSYLMKEGLNYPAFCPINVEIYTDYLNIHHFDWRIDDNGRTLIEKGLALEAKEGLYKIKEK